MYELLEAQKIIYDMECLNEKEMAWLAGSILKCGKCDVDKIEQAVNKMIELNDSLRTKIISNGDSPYQIVEEYEYKKIPIRYYQNREELFEDNKKLVKQPLEDRNALAAFYILVTPEEFGVTAKINHMISDAWSYAMMANQFYSIYDSLMNNTEINVECYSYIDYVKKEKEYLASSRFEAAKKFWMDQYENCTEVTYLADDRKKSYDTERKYTVVSKDFVEKITKYCNSNGGSILSLVMTAVGTYMYQIRDKSTFYIGTALLNRIGKIEKNTMGMFVSTVPILMDMQEEESFSTNMKKNMTSIMKVFKHQRYNYRRMLEDIYEKYHTNDALYDVLVSYQNSSIYDNENHTSYSYTCGSQIESLQIHIDDRDQKGELIICYDYHTDKFTDEDIERLHQHLVNIMEEAANADSPIKDISLVTDNEMHLIMDQFNNTQKKFQDGETIVGLFEKQVEKTPDRVAVVDEKGTLTFHQLNQKANALGHKLRNMGIGRNDFVVVVTDRSAQMIEGIYSIIKSGAAYVPIDPNYPDDRIQYILDDCNPKAVLVYSNKVNRGIFGDVPVIDLADERVFEGQNDNLEIINTPSDILYVIYTSGTTGNPKGVMNKNSSLINRIMWMDGRYPLNEEDTILQKTTYTFDVSVWEIIWWSIVGAKVVMLVPGGEKDPREICKAIKKNNVTVMHFVPSMLNVFLNYIEDYPDEINTLGSLKYVFSSGEALNSNQANMFNALIRSKYENALLVNLYGPTEAAIDVTYFECDDNYDRIPIGKPIDNTQIYIFKRDKMCGIEVPGELCIAGVNVAKGYLNKPELTKEKFVDNPYGPGKMYKTGDLARWLPDGNIDYLGRIDDQVKIRGFRIELGEIETRLREICDIKDCAVIAKEDSFQEKAIFAYYVSEKTIDVSVVKSELSKSLPYYMVPAYILQIDEIPVTKNGKLDRRALPNVENKVLSEYVMPRNDEESQICNIFEEVLNVEKVGILDNFFEIGGHSLRATRVVNKIEQTMGVKIELGEIFKNPTPESLAKLVMESDGKGYDSIPVATQKDVYPMSSTQKRLFLLNQIDKDSLAYNMPAAFIIHGEIEQEKLKTAMEQMVERHEILRTSFEERNGELLQIISKSVDVDFEYVDEDKKTDEEILNSFVQPFDLGKASLLRMKLINRKGYYLFLFDMHHIVSDGFSLNFFKKELSKIYNGEELECLTHQYKDYSEWMRTRDISSQAEYWKNEFSDEIPALDMPLDYVRPQEQSYRGSMIETSISRKLGANIKSIAAKCGATEFMVFTSALMILLSKYSRQEDIVIGTPISGRVHRDTEQMLGMFVNTLALRGKPESNKTYREFLEEIKNTCLKAYENQEYPFEELVEAVDVKRDMSRNPIFDIMIVLQNNENEELILSDSKIERIGIEDTVAKFDMTLYISESSKDEYSIDLEYCTDLYKKESIEYLLKHFIAVLEEVTNDLSISLANVSVLDEEEKGIVLSDFNNTDVAYQDDKTIVELFEEQVKKTPNNIAVVYKDESITYEQLNSKANQLANKLREQGVGADDFVAVITERSIEMIVGIYGVIKSGGAYVPIDPTYPDDRIAFILEDSNPKVVLTYKKEITTTIPVIKLEETKEWNGVNENPPVINNSESSIYCIYTSGTTGKPKGVPNKNKGLINRIMWMHSRYPLAQNDVVLQKTTFTFDVSVWEIVWWSLVGARVVMLNPGSEKSPEDIKNAIKKYGVTHMHFVPSMLNMFLMNLELDGGASDLASLKYVFSSGEALSTDHLKLFNKLVRSQNENTRLINFYGPTEASIDVTYFDCEYDYNVLPIGKPIDNTSIYIMQGDMACGIGIPGELCITGVGLAKGYLNRPELTSEKFVENPFGDGRMYHTGDLARWMPDGNIEYLGRIDDQVKIRGFRIELGEIASRIREVENVKDCAVIARADVSGEKAIYAYYVGEVEVSISTIREALLKNLPEYMVPAYMMQIDSIPVTKNGKLDRRALSSIEITNTSTREYIPPRDEKEEIVCSIFSEILGVKEIGVEDNFFENGGDSIKAIRIISKLRAAGYSAEVKDVMMATTAEKLAKIISKDENRREYEQGEVVGRVSKTPIMNRFDGWELEKPNHFNQANMLSVNGVENDVIRNSLEELVKHHDILRAVYKNHQLEILPMDGQVVFDFYEYDYQMEDNSDVLIQKTCTDIQGSIDLENGPLVKAAIFKTKSDKLLFIAIHHLVVDGVSWRIIQEDLETLISQSRDGKERKLPQKTASFIEWSETLKRYKTSDKVLQHREFWNEINAEVAEAKVFKDCENAFCGYGEETIDFDEELTKQLVNEACSAYKTSVEELLISALVRSLRQWKMISKIAINMEGHGRDEVDEKIDIDRTVGWFTTMYPVIVECRDDAEDLILGVKESFWKVNGKENSYGLLIEQDANQPDVTFNYLGDFGVVEGRNEKLVGASIAPENKFTSAITVNCSVFNNQLNTTVIYDKRYMNAEELMKFFELYQSSVKEIVNLCIGNDEELLTIYDLDEDLDVDELDAINSLFE